MKITIETTPNGMPKWIVHTTEEVSEKHLIDILRTIVDEMEELIKTQS